MSLLRGLTKKEIEPSLVGQVWEHTIPDSTPYLYLVVSEVGRDSRLLSLDDGCLYWMRTDHMQDSRLWRRVT